jgi:GntR family transcriptional regulator
MVDKDSILPFYYQIKELLLREIRRGKYGVGEKIPGELDLAKEFQVSRPTVRQAINELVFEKVLWRERGKGTFVNQPKIDSRLDVLTPFVEELQSQGLLPGLVIVSNKLVVPSANIARALDLADDEKAIEFVRVRLANNNPVILRTSYFNYKLMPFLLTTDKEELEPLYPHIESHWFKMTRAEQTLQVVQARKHEANLLQVATGFPLILWEGIVSNYDGRPLEYVKSLYRGDRYKFYITQQRGK